MAHRLVFVFGPIRVLLADRSTAGRRRIRNVLRGMDEVELIGETGSDAGMIRAARRRAPGVIVIRSTLARRELLRASDRIRRESPEVQIIAVTGDEPKVFLRIARGFGISFCVPRRFVEIRLPSLVRLAHRDHCESVETILRRRLSGASPSRSPSRKERW